MFRSSRSSSCGENPAGAGVRFSRVQQEVACHVDLDDENGDVDIPDYSLNCAQKKGNQPPHESSHTETAQARFNGALIQSSIARCWN